MLISLSVSRANTPPHSPRLYNRPHQYLHPMAVDTADPPDLNVLNVAVGSDLKNRFDKFIDTGRSQNHGSQCGPSAPRLPIGSPSPRKRGPYSTPKHTMASLGYFRGCDLFDWRRLSVGLLGWFIRLGQELIDHARTLLLLYSSLLRSLLFGPEFVIYFPAH